MYAAPNFAGLSQPVYNPASIASNLNFFVNTPDNELNQLTPRLAQAACAIFVKNLEKNTPMRVGTYNVVAENGFVNEQFRSFVTKCMKSAYVAMEQNQTTSIQDVCTRLLPEWIDLFSAALTLQFPHIQATLSQDVLNSVAEKAKMFSYWVQETDNALGKIYQNAIAKNQMSVHSVGTYFQQAHGNIDTNHHQVNRVNTGAPTGFGVIVEQHTSMQDGGIPSVGHSAIGQGHYARRLQQERNSANEKAQWLANQQAQNQHRESNTSIMAGETYVSNYTTRLRAEMGTAKPTGRWGSMDQVTNVPANQPVQPTLVAGYVPAAAPAPSPRPSEPPAPPPGSFVPNYSADVLPSAASDIEAKAVVAEAQSQEAIDFDKAVMDFSVTPVAVVAPTPETHLEKKQVISTAVMNGHELRVVAMLEEGVSFEDSGWKPSKFQYYYPAFCVRTHYILYAVADEGEVVAITIPFNEKEREEMFNYEAHAINPTMGRPSVTLEKPVREEAKVLYAAEVKVVKIKVSEKPKLSAHVSELEQQCKVAARAEFKADPGLQLVAVQGMNYEYIGADSPEELAEMYEQLRNVRLKITYGSAADAIGMITSPQLRKKVEDLFTSRFNTLLRDRLAIGGDVESFAKEAADAPEQVREHLGDVVADALVEIQSEFIAETMDVLLAEEIPAVARFRSGLDDDEQIDQYMKSSMFLASNHLVMNSRYTADELAISAFDKVAQLDSEAYPALHSAIYQAMNDESYGNQRFSTYTLHSSDDSSYAIYKSPLNQEMLLIKPL